MRIEGKFKGCIDVKRFYMPGIMAYDNCPVCKKECCIDFSDEYISYPDSNSSTAHFFCIDCEDGWPKTITIGITVTPK